MPFFFFSKKAVNDCSSVATGDSARVVGVAVLLGIFDADVLFGELVV